MLITKNVPLNFIGKIKPNETIYIDKDVSLDTNFLELILQKFPDSKITIMTSDDYSNFSTDVLYTHDELEILSQNINLARTKYNRDISFDDEFTIEQAIEASRKLNDWEKLINEATINGQTLSQLEKYMLAYSLVSKRFYKLENEDENKSLSRNIISVLNDDYICCAGFANTLANLCARIGIPCSTRTCAIWGPEEKDQTPHWSNHANCIVRIEDDKYNVHGFFNADPTWDAILSKYADQIDEIDFNFNFKHFLIPHNEYETRFPNIVLDRATTFDDKYNERRPTSITQINSISCLFPDISINSHINTSIYNSQTHAINFELLKHQTIKRLNDIIDGFETEKTSPRFNMEDFTPTIETIVSYFVQESFEYKPEEKNEYIPYLKEYFETLLCHFSKEDLKKTFSEYILNIDIETFLKDYSEYLNYLTNESNFYDKYNYEYVKRRSKTTPVSSETLTTLFETMFPIMFDFDSKEQCKLFSKKIVSKFSPVALLAEQKTPQ